MPTKRELFKWMHIAHHAEMMVWDRWFDWRLKQAGVTYDDKEKWEEMLDNLPSIIYWRPLLTEDMMRIEWESGSEFVPLEEFYDDDKQPDLELLWHSGYWDGPLSGMARYNGEEVWFDCLVEDDYGDRTFGLYRLSDEDKAELNHRHKLFREMVGHHCDHHPDLYADFVCRDEQKFKEFYEMKFPKNDRTKGEKLAEVHWFEFKYWGRPKK